MIYAAAFFEQKAISAATFSEREASYITSDYDEYYFLRFIVIFPPPRLDEPRSLLSYFIRQMKIISFEPAIDTISHFIIFIDVIFRFVAHFRLIALTAISL